MISIRIRNELIHLPAGVNLRLKLRNPVYTGGDFDFIDGSFSFPVDIPVTPQQQRLFNFPERLDSTDRMLEDEPCTILVQGNDLFEAFATITTSTSRSLRWYFVIRSASFLQDLKLSQFDLGGVRDFEGATTQELRRFYAKGTAVNPLAYDYALFPVHNYALYEDDDDPDTVESEYQNYYDKSTGKFTSSSDLLSVTPFIRLSYLLERITAELGPLNNEWQNTPELQQLYLYNNRSIVNLSGDWDDFDLINHVPDITASDLLKEVMKYNIGVGYNPLTGATDIVPIDTVIQRDPSHDWTSISSGEYGKENIPIAQRTLSYADDSNDTVEENFRLFIPREEDLLDTYVGVNDMPAPTQYGQAYYIESKCAIHGHDFFTSGQQEVQHVKRYLSVQSEVLKKQESISLQMRPLHMREQFFDDDDYMPQIVSKGSFPAANIYNDFALRIMSYKGMHDNGSGAYPFASNTEYYPSDTPLQLGDVSLSLTGERGIYETYWKRWLDLLQTTYKCNRTIALTLPDLLRFKFTDTVRIESQHYLVSELDLQIGSQGISPATATLIRL